MPKVAVMDFKNPLYLIWLPDRLRSCNFMIFSPKIKSLYVQALMKKKLHSKNLFSLKVVVASWCLFCLFKLLAMFLVYFNFFPHRVRGIRGMASCAFASPGISRIKLFFILFGKLNVRSFPTPLF